jgi:hypothetical protein
VTCWRQGLGVALLFVAVAGCDRRRQAHAGDGPYADRVATAVPQIEAATGLKFKTPPKLEVRSRAQVREFLLKTFEETNRPSEVRGEESAFKLFGLIPDTLKLQQFLISLYTEQIEGYYDPGTKVLYVVQDAPEDLVNITITHELVHALQDQYVNLDSIEKTTGNSDRQAAAQAVMEGQATYEQTSIMLGGGSLATRLPGGIETIRQTIREQQATMPVFASAPMAIQEAVLFPYLSGFEFIRRADAHGRKAHLLDSLPTSSEQIVSDAAYFGTPRDEPSDVILPPTTDTASYEETMGEFGTRLFLYQHLQNNTDAISAAQGWDGDRYRVVRTPKGPGLVWVSVWDSPVEGAQFVDALGQAIGKRYRTFAPSVSSAGVRTYTNRVRDVVVTPMQISGRDVVMYVDVPSGVSPAVIAAGRIVIHPR